MDKDTRKVLKAAEDQGFTWDTTRSGHPRVWDADGNFVTTLSGTPGDRKGLANAIAAMRRRGFVWPPKR